jgi:hypothetical protein
MKNIILSILALYITISINLYSQDTSRTSLIKDKFALQFQVNGLYIHQFQGNSLSFKYHLSDVSALRFGIELFGATEIDYRYNNNSRPKRENLTVNLKTQYVWYIKTVDDISLYCGTGPFYSRYFRDDKSSSYYNSNSWTVGLQGLLGVEWFFKNNMSLSGEYGIAVGYNNSNYSVSNGDWIHSVNINLSSGDQFKIGLSVYL